MSPFEKPPRDPKIVDFRRPKNPNGSLNGSGRKPQRERVFNDMPAVLLWIVGLNLAVWLAALASDMPDNGPGAIALPYLVLVPAAWYDNGHLLPHPLAAVVSLVGYQFTHFGLLHLAMNMLIVVAVGRPIARLLGTRHFIDFYLLCGALGGLLYVVLHLNGAPGAIGASGAIAGLYGGLFQLIQSGNQHYLRGSERNAALSLLVLLVFQVAVGIGTSQLGMGQTAWETHVGGALAGYLLFPAFARAIRTRGGGR